MNDITIIDAINGSTEALATVVMELSSDVEAMATEVARRYEGLSAEDMAQDAWVMILETTRALTVEELRGDKIDAFRAITLTNARKNLLDKAREHRYQGIDKDAIKAFTAALRSADGDASEAERIIVEDLPKGRRVSKERAHAARLSWEGAASVERPMGDDGLTLADTIGVEDTYEWSSDADERNARIGMVHAALYDMYWKGRQQYDVLTLSYGIGDRPCFGTGDGCDNEGLVAYLEMKSVTSLTTARGKALKNFAANYIKYAAGSEAEAVELARAAVAGLARGGRK